MKKLAAENHDLERVRKEYMAILRGTPHGLCMVNPNWKIRWANASMRRIFEPDSANTEDIVDLPFACFFENPESFEEFHRDVRKEVRKQGTVIREIPLNRINGEPFEAEISIVRVDPSQTDPGYVITVQDITRHKDTIKELRLRARMENLLTQISVTFMNLSDEEVDEGINESLRMIAEFCGMDRAYIYLTSEDGRRMMLSHIWPGDNTPRSKTPEMALNMKDFPWGMNNLKTGRDIIVFSPEELPRQAGAEQKALKKTGAQCLVAVPLSLRQTLKGAICLASITQRRLWNREMLSLLKIAGRIFINALERKKSAEKLRESRIELQTIFDGMADGLIVSDGNTGKLLKINPIMMRMLGYTENQMLKVKLENIYPAEELDRIISELSSKSENEMIYCRDLCCLRKDGKTLIADLKARRIRYRDRECIISILRDASQRKEAENEKAKLTEQLMKEKRLAVIGQTIAGISHSMKNLITVLQGGVDLLVKAIENHDWGATQKSQEMLNRCSRRLYMLLMNMLDYSKSRGIVKEDVQMNSVFHEVIQMLEQCSRNEDIAFKYQIAPGAKIWRTDSERLFRALLNLGSNAMDAMPEGGLLRFRASVKKCNDKSLRKKGIQIPYLKGSEEILQLDVEDSGEGLDEKVAGNIFEPFYSTKGSGGTGLGLASVKQFIDDAGGAIHIDCGKEKGTTFSIFLP